MEDACVVAERLAHRLRLGRVEIDVALLPVGRIILGGVEAECQRVGHVALRARDANEREKLVELIMRIKAART